MKKPISRRGVIAAALAAAMFLCIGAYTTVRLITEEPDAVQTFSATARTSFCPTVVDAQTGEPICDAVLVIVDTQETFATREDGSPGAISVAAKKDTRFDHVLSKGYAEVGFVVYKEGYAPYALFYLTLNEGEVRVGPNIALFPGDVSGAPMVIAEGPESAWAEALTQKLNPF